MPGLPRARLDGHGVLYAAPGNDYGAVPLVRGYGDRVARGRVVTSAANTGRGGAFVLSWGRYGGLYVHRRRLCLGWVALTYLPYDLDDWLRASLDAEDSP